ncbi:restriction endonuclease subunit S [Enterococcus faecalis]|uniref:restriction endonuclease subunit S n=1 Tax=Enterococcus TaxID=1350 RepID=UPI00032D8B3C|nr:MULTISPECIES: restriction endonuclease subunit S [Enterococcus]EGO7927326.1 restriction endonuclease subunit S [Enterococcus faecalis]EGO8246887.1 restriction endonuclease subunit S [Enterococcus faecalis]EJM6074831.1 restriction endonuclease subunit S [Enterococcus faecalis]EKQ3639044.1 restriction endonuclease subunit S [Enterococcus faecalis]ELT8952386.1 restriction endonuclease subunit S [Enterococcus faecalis]
MSNDTQPEIRFPGFTDDWEQRKLGDFVVDYVEKTSVQNQFPMLTSSQQKGIVLQEDYFANRQVTTENNIGYFVLPRGYFTFRSRSDNDVFVFNRNDIIDRGIISYFYPVFTLKSADSDFFLRRINNGIQRQLSIQAEGTGQHVLSLKKFKNIVAMFPSEEEQQKIGTFFKQLDDTIALHQRKLDLLKETKKGFLQKMFPKNGAKVPEIRFPGFTEDWEQRKLGDLGSVAMNKRIFKDQTSDNGEVPFFKIGTFGSHPDAFISRELFEEYKSKYPYPEVGDILISASGSIGRTVVYQGEDEYFQDSNIVWLKHNGRLDNKFLQQFYSIVKWQGLEGSTIKRLYNKNILDTNISVPTLDEQNKLGAFFEQLDDTIALQQRKLDLLKETKKGFLQKMFV